MVSVMYGIGVHALGGSDRAGIEEKHRSPALRALRAGARRNLVVNMSSGRQLMMLPSHDGEVEFALKLGRRDRRSANSLDLSSEARISFDYQHHPLLSILDQV
jgi:hypothetical protein